MDTRVKIIFEDTVEDRKMPAVLKGAMKKVCTGILREEGLYGTFEVSVTFTDDNEIHRINKEFRNIDAPTDVLSFPLSEDGIHFDFNMSTNTKLLGDIVISVERAQAQAEEYGHSFHREMCYLTAHSMLHLLSYDHVEGAQVPEHKAARAMRRKEEKVLEELGILRFEGMVGNE